MDESILESGFLEELQRADEALRCGLWKSFDEIRHRSDATHSSTLSKALSTLLILDKAVPRAHSARPTWAPDTISRFEIISVLGAGGFSVVYLAHDPRLDRKVALKVPRPHALINPELRARFLTEAQAAARLDHPNIVPIFEAGEDGDISFIAFALCAGPTLGDWLKDRERPAEPELAAYMLHCLARAVQYSHDRGILHRDLKPGNVLLFPDSRSPRNDFPFVPRISDFGLAKLIEEAGRDTASSQMLGTPQYMAPEQLSGGRQPIGPQADVYSLGALLYFLLTGQPPFSCPTIGEALRQISERDAVPLQFLNPSLPTDLCTIADRCLNKSPSDRYLTARDLADDLERFLDGRPIVARPLNRPQRFLKLCRRRPLLTVLGLMIGTLLLLMFFQWIRYASSLTVLNEDLNRSDRELKARVELLNKTLSDSTAAREQSENQRKAGMRLVYASSVHAAGRAWQNGDPEHARRFLDNSSEAVAEAQLENEFAAKFLYHQVSGDSQQIQTEPQDIWNTVPSPDGRLLAVCGSKGIICLHDCSPGFPILRRLQQSPSEVNQVAFSDDHRLLVAVDDDGTAAVWSVDSGELLRSIQVIENGRAYGVTFLKNRHQFVVCGKSTALLICDADTGEIVSQVPSKNPRTIETITRSHDGQFVFSGGLSGLIECVDVSRLQPVWSVQASDYSVLTLAVSPNDEHLVFGDKLGNVMLLNAANGEAVTTISLWDPVHTMTWMSDSQLACGTRSGVLTVLELQLHPVTKQIAGFSRLFQRKVHTSSIQTLALVNTPGTVAGTPSSHPVLVSGGRENQLLQTRQSQLSTAQIFHPSSPAVSSTFEIGCPGLTDGSMLRLTETGFEIIDTTSGSIRNIDLSHVLADDKPLSIAVNLHRQLILLGLFSKRIAVLNHDGSLHRIITLNQSSLPYRLRMSPDGKRFLYFHDDTTRELGLGDLDAEDSNPVRQLPNRGPSCFSPDGKLIASVEQDSNHLEILDGDSLDVLRFLGKLPAAAGEVHWSPYGFLVVGCSDRVCRVWETQNWQLIHELTGHSSLQEAIDLSPDGRTLAVGDRAGSLRLWDPTTGQELLAFPPQPAGFRHVYFTENGKSLTALDFGYRVHVFRSDSDPQ